MIAQFVRLLSGLVYGMTPVLAGSLDGLNTMSMTSYSSDGGS
ncbi:MULTISPECIES: hypothetical protein [Rhodococcus]|nr:MULTISPECIES: hypothetical protein [Rhodococcus]